MRHKNGHWSKEKVIRQARLYETKKEWRENSPTSYRKAKNKGWFEDATKHMKEIQRPLNYWTRERLLKDASLYTSKKEWKENSSSAYVTARRKGILDECTQGMTSIRKPTGYWTKDKCLKSSLKYLTIKEWSLEDGPAYDAAKRNGWVQDVTEHMTRLFSHGELTIYRFLLQYDIEFIYQKRFKDLVYVKELPCDFYIPSINLIIEYQGRQHYSVSDTSMFVKDINTQRKRDQIKRDYAISNKIHYLEISTEKIKAIEDEIINKFISISGKFNYVKRALSEDETIVLQNIGKWDKESVLKEALKYSNASGWRYCGNASEQVARKNGWYEEATKHFETLKQASGTWSKKNVIQSAQKYSTRNQWKSKEPSAFTTAYREGWIDEATKHMDYRPVNKNRQPDGTWTRQNIINKALEYDDFTEYRLSADSGYRYASEIGILDDVTKHMKRNRKPPGYWTLENVMNDAEKYQSKKEWRLSRSGGYAKALKMNWLKDVITKANWE